MKVLVACEFSGTVRDAFAKKGHDAWSCDLRPTEAPGNHIQGDAIQIAYDKSMGWDLMIAHPPCTKLSYVANGHMSKAIKQANGCICLREQERAVAMEFFLKLANAPIDKKALENPLGWPCKVFRQQDQIIHPFEFGERTRKRICLWLKNLPPLFCTMFRKPEEPSWIGPTGKKGYFVLCTNGKDREKKRSVFFPGIAAAMAEQWSW